MTPPPTQSNYKAMISPTHSSMTALLGSETLLKKQSPTSSIVPSSV